MDIKILDSWLREFLDTTATPPKIAEYLSLCGPSVERIEDFKNDKLYDIEVTTNRVDTASVYGIAREASAILPRFNVAAKLKQLRNESKDYKFVKKVKYLNATVDTELCSRFSAVLIKNVKNGNSPKEVVNRLESAGVRSINNIVDISNYIMLELGQPVHTFDYDKIKGTKMLLRESKKGEKITTLDGKEFTLLGGDIVIEDGEGRLIDLAGVMGGNLSAVDDNTKNVLLFVQTYNPIKIRKTSMSLAQRTLAATIFEKGTDTELVTPAILKGIELFVKLCKGVPESEILNIYPNPPKTKVISVDLEFIENRLGVTLPKKDISSYLNSLDFEANWQGSILKVSVPSFRQKDVLDKEDVVEEIARIYGYHNLPSELMTGKLTGRSSSPQFTFEFQLKNYLADWGGSEVYTLSLVPKEYAPNGLKLKNPLGTDAEYLRTSLMPSLISAADWNKGKFEKFHMFEMANVYLPKKNDLPTENLMLSGIFEGYDYRHAKGIIEALFSKLNIDPEFASEEMNGFSAGRCVAVKSNGETLGYLGYVNNSDYIYYEFEVNKLFAKSLNKKVYKPIPKFPAQVEDITFIFPKQTFMGAVVKSIENVNSRVNRVELKDVFNDSYTFRVYYQDDEKTLNDREVEEIRNKIISEVKSKFAGEVK